MNQKIVKALRFICEMSRENNSYDRKMFPVEQQQVAVIDGVNGNHHVRDDYREEIRTTDERALYRQLKKIYSNSNHELHEQVKQDVQNFIKNTNKSAREEA